MPMTADTQTLNSSDEIFKIGIGRLNNTSEQVREISLDDLFPFENHPFLVRDDEAMRDTAESIKKYGVLVPGIARPRPESGYELVSGHRRKRGCELAGKSTMPVIVRNLNDSEATIIMVDSNLQRETLLPSEKAWAYRMKLEAMNHRGIKAEGGKPGALSVEALAEQAGESKSQIFRYIRLTELVPDLLDMADEGKIAFNPAVELSYLKRKEQSELFDIMEMYVATPSLSQAQQMKKHSQAGKLTRYSIESILSEPKKESVKVMLPGNRLHRYFPDTYTPKQMETVIIKLLEVWHKRQRG